MKKLNLRFGSASKKLGSLITLLKGFFSKQLSFGKKGTPRDKKT